MLNIQGLEECGSSIKIENSVIPWPTLITCVPDQLGPYKKAFTKRI